MGRTRAGGEDPSSSIRPPHPALAGLVGPYVGYRSDTAPGEAHRGLPSTSATVIIAFGEPLDTQWQADPSSRGRFWTLAAGLHIRPALIHSAGTQHGVQLSLTPLGARRLLGVPLGTLAETLVSHGDLPLGLSDNVSWRMWQAPTWADRFRLLDRVLIDNLRRMEPRVPDDLARAWQMVWAVDGRRPPVSEIADRLGWRERRLRTRFRTEFGVSVRQAAGLGRLEEARELADRVSRSPRLP